MNPLIAIAASILPDILKSVIGRRSGEVAEAVTRAVSDAAGTAEPESAREKIEADPQIEKELRIALAEIAAEEDEQRRQAELAAQKLQIEEAESQQKAGMAVIQARFEEDARRRNDDFRRLQAGIADTRSARTSFTGLAGAGNPFAWGPVAVSVVVTIGFFWILLVLLGRWGEDLRPSPEISQIINISIGALTAGFATVISFWLGSSQGSRNKDFAAVEVQARNAHDTARIIERQAQQAEVILRTRPGGDREAGAKPKASSFARCIDIVLEKEGGYGDHPQDPGGPTNMGITLRTLKAWRGGDITSRDVQELTLEEARNIYEANYWKPLNCDGLPAGVDLVVFDFGVNAGPARAARLLQRVCGTNQDGVIGPITAGAAQSLDPRRVIGRFSELRMAYYRSLETWTTFGRGWTRRTEEVERAALAMIG